MKRQKDLLPFERQEADTSNVRRILVDVSHASDSRMNTGIQRVVRNVVAHLPYWEKKLGVRILTIKHRNGDYYPDSSILKNKHQTRSFGDRFREFCSGLWRKVPFGTREVLTVVGKRIRKTLYPKAIVRFFTKLFRRLFVRPVDFREGDLLLLLDAVWQVPYRQVVQEAKAKKVSTVAVVYDLIPICHPEFFEANPAQKFEQCFQYLVDEVDGFTAISETVSDELCSVTRERFGKSESISSNSFKLGADFQRYEAKDAASEPVRKVFDVNTPVFLTVGTVEPRKNHRFLLDGFERAWSEGVDARLVIAGRPGWLTDDLQNRIRRHQELGSRLFWFDDASDADIQFLYQSSRALVYPSIVEGFGLPIVESYFHGTPVLASNTAIHREVGGEFCKYFPLDDPATLVDLIRETAATSKPTSVEGLRLVNWQESCGDLLWKALAHKSSVASQKTSRHTAQSKVPREIRERIPA